MEKRASRGEGGEEKGKGYRELTRMSADREKGLRTHGTQMTQRDADRDNLLKIKGNVTAKARRTPRRARIGRFANGKGATAFARSGASEWSLLI